MPLAVNHSGGRLISNYLSWCKVDNCIETGNCPSVDGLKD